MEIELWKQYLKSNSIVNCYIQHQPGVSYKNWDTLFMFSLHLKLALDGLEITDCYFK